MHFQYFISRLICSYINGSKYSLLRDEYISFYSVINVYRKESSASPSKRQMQEISGVVRMVLEIDVCNV